MKLPAMIIAGGQARRFGGVQKCLLPFGTSTILGEILAAIGPHCDPIALNSNAAGDAFQAFDLAVIRDGLDPPVGPLGGLLTALEWARGLGRQAVVTVPGDTPFLPRDLVARLAAKADRLKPVIAAAEDGLYPVTGLWPVALADRLRADVMAGARAVHSWAADVKADVVVFPSDHGHPFENVNTVEDLARAATRWSLRRR